MRWNRRLLFSLGILLLLGVTSAVQAGFLSTSISVQFGVGGTNGGPALAPTQVAGVVPSMNWNVAVGDSGTLGGLIQDTNGVGSATGASVTWSSNNTWTHGPSNFTPGSGNDVLMTSYLDGETNGVPATATFSGLTGGLYNVYVYSADAQETIKESGGFFINGTHVPGSGDGSVGGPTFIQSSPGVTGNYIFLGDVTPTAGGVISISDDGTSFRIPMNGVELVAAVPEPASITTMLLGALSLCGSGFAGAWMRWRRKA
jgi:hypothetical protein